jgi:homotetrameric cytidine deaminase
VSPSSAPRRNIELKARDADPQGTLRRALALGADDRGTLTQRDTYFAAARGRLKLREEEPGAAHLIAYERPDAALARESRYRLAPATDAAATRDALESALGTTVVVAKRRRLLLWEGVRIHLDDVEGLGTFVELEGPAAGSAAESELAIQHELVARLRSELRIGEDAIVAQGYADLLTDGPGALLAAAEAAMRRAYAPYSRFRVGAALRAPDGSIVAGANVENASYPQGQCAETSAVGALVTAGHTTFTAAAVVAEQLDVCPPCGGCRQRLAELAGPATPVHLGRPGGPVETHTLGELLPLAFAARELSA